jgi:hypothetical protein
MSFPKLKLTDKPSRNSSSSLSRWKEIRKTYENHFGPYNKWIFRGMKNHEYRLETSLQRAVIPLTTIPDNIANDEKERYALENIVCGSKKNQKIWDLEGGMIRYFRRQCHHFLSKPPSNTLETLALMQHYSAPTRLQDWTYSFYVALFFALEGSIPDYDCAVWACNIDWIRKRFKQCYPELFKIIDHDRNLDMPSSFKGIFRNEKLFVCPVNPYSLNDRLIIQQGVFLCPGSVNRPFEDNIVAMQYDNCDVSLEPIDDAERKIIKIRISTKPETRIEILHHMLRMNISAATLFPGLQGFARSLENKLAFPDILEFGPNYEPDFDL